MNKCWVSQDAFEMSPEAELWMIYLRQWILCFATQLGWVLQINFVKHFNVLHHEEAHCECQEKTVSPSEKGIAHTTVVWTLERAAEFGQAPKRPG